MTSWVKIRIDGLLWVALFLSKLYVLIIELCCVEWGIAIMWLSSQFFTSVASLVGSRERERERKSFLETSVWLDSTFLEEGGRGRRSDSYFSFVIQGKFIFYNSYLQSYDNTRNLVMLNPLFSSFSSRNSPS